MVDKALILRKFADLDQHLDELKEFADITSEEYGNDWKTQRIVERTLQIMIEICADIAGHIISDKKFRTPDSYSDAYQVLGEHGVIDGDVSRTMQEMARFRNIIVHGYDKVDHGIVTGILRRRLDDFVAYREAILGYLGTVS